MRTLIFIPTIVALASFAQGTMKFVKETYDFGNLEEGPTASYTFEFTNTGNQPVIISNVQASCGCTTPDWSKEPILPNQKGFIKATYSTAGRLGQFTKSITISSNAEETSKTLFIKGVVSPKNEKVEYSAKELESSPKIELNKYAHNYGKVERGQRLVAKFTAKNVGKSDLEFKSIESACNCVGYNALKTKLKPQESTVVEVYYTPNGKNEIMDIAYLKTNDLNQPSVKIELSATVVESLNTKSPLKEENNSFFK